MSSAATDDGEQSTDEEMENEISLVGSTPVKKCRISKTRPFTNPVHEWFLDITGDSKCIVCSKIVSGKHATNLKNHLKKHPPEFKKFTEKSQSTDDVCGNKQLPKSKNTSTTSLLLTDCFQRMAEKKQGLQKGSDAYEIAVKAIGIAFLANSLSYRLIEDPYFKAMIATISEGRLINLPSRQEMPEIVESLTEQLKSKVSASVKAANYISLTIDLWSRPGYSSAMMGVTGHFFDRKAKETRRILLACRSIKQPHTGENIFDLYNDIRNGWNLAESKILRVVTDNGSNIVKAFKECLLVLTERKQKFPDITSLEAGPSSSTTIASASAIPANQAHIPGLDDEDPDDDEAAVEASSIELSDFDFLDTEMDTFFYCQKRISCFAHNLMLVVRVAVDDNDKITEAKKKAESLISSITQSAKAVQELKGRTPNGIGLIKPVRTRWIYWYYVFNRLIKIKRQICEVCDDLSIMHDLGPMDWRLLELVRDLLEPFTQAVTRVEGETYVTISEVYAILFSLEAKLNEMLQNNTLDRSLLRLIKQLKSEMDSRFKLVRSCGDEKFDPIFVLATLLDFRYGLLIEGELLVAAKQELQRLVATAVPASMSRENLVEANFSRCDFQDGSDGLKSDLLAAALRKINEKRRLSAPSDSSSAVNQEFDMYIQDIGNLNDFDIKTDLPLAFWLKRADKYPQMYTIAVDVLSIPATSAPCEQIFSRASYILSKKRHNLKDEKLEQELFFKVNIDYLL